MVKFEQHINILNNDSSVIDELKNACSEHNLSIGQIKTAIQKGALWLSRKKHTTRLRKVKKALQENDTLHFYYDPSVLSQVPQEAKLISDQQGYSVWYKPYGMLSQGSKWSDHCTIARWAETHLTPQRPAFIVHRLDRAASGLIIIAHSKSIARAFSQMFEQHDLEKRYQIIVHGQLADQVSEEVGQVVETAIDNKSAKSTFYPVESYQDKNVSLIEVKIDSGRKHQIRIHAASIGLPVVGDRLHGDTEQPLSQQVNLQLCAVKLAFRCPVSQQEKSFQLPSELSPSLAKVTQQLNL